MADSVEYEPSQGFLILLCGIGGLSVVGLAIALFVGSSDPTESATGAPPVAAEVTEAANARREPKPPKQAETAYSEPPREEPATPTVVATAQKWYEGGTLHKATMGEWNRATYANKLATCADLLAALHKAQGYDIATIDIEGTLRPAAEAFVLELDAANKDGSNDRVKVAEAAAVIAAIIEKNGY